MLGVVGVGTVVGLTHRLIYGKGRVMEANTGGRQARPPEEFGSTGGLMRDFPGRLWSLATSPGQFFREVPGSGGYLNSVIFVTLSFLAIPVVLGIVGAVVGIPIALIAAAGSENTSLSGVFGVLGLGLLGVLLFIVLMPIFIAVGLFVGSCIQHLFVMLFAGDERREFGETFKVMAYAVSPAAFISWIPVAGFFGSIWQIVLTVIGIKEVHRTSTGRAVMAVAAPLLIVLLLSLAVAVTAAVLGASLSGSTTAGGGAASGSGAPPTVQASQGEPQQSQSDSSGQSGSRPASTPSGAAPAYGADLPDPSTDTSQGVAVQNVGFSRDDYGTLKFYGEVLNEGEDDLVAPQVTIKLYNDEDEIVGQTSALGPLPTVIRPDQRGLWDATLSGDDAPEDWSRTEIEVIEDEALAETYSQMYYPDLEASNAQLNPADPYSTPTVTAEVSNTGDQAAETVLASAGIYDEDGTLVDVASLTSSGSTAVRAGESSLFEGYVDNPEVDAGDDYDVAVYLDGTKPLQ